MAAAYLNLINETLRYLKEPSAASVGDRRKGQWSVWTIGQRVNKAHHELLAAAGGLRVTYTESSEAGEPAYTLRSDIISVYSILYDGKKLIPSNPGTMAATYDDYNTETGTPLFWYFGPTQGNIGFAPVCEADGTDNIEIEGGSVALNLASANDAAFLGDTRLGNLYSEAIVYGAVLKCLIEEADERYGFFKREYEDLKKQFVADIRNPVGETIAWTVKR